MAPYRFLVLLGISNNESLTTKFNRVVALTWDTQHAVFASWELWGTWIFDAHSPPWLVLTFSDNCCDVQPWVSPWGLCLVCVHVPSSGLYKSFSCGLGLSSFRDGQEMHCLWGDCCYQYPCLLSSIQVTMGSGSCLILGHQIHADWFLRGFECREDSRSMW